MKPIRFITAFIIILFGVPTAYSADIKVSARLDSLNILMGKIDTLRIEVDQPANIKGGLTIFDKIAPNAEFIGICGDSIDLSVKYKSDTVNSGANRIKINYAIPVQPFDSGMFTLPEFVFAAGNDSAKSKNVILNVLPVKVSVNDEPEGFSDVAEPEGKRFYDFIPDCILDFWWIFLIIVIAIILFLKGYSRYKSTGKLLPPKPELSPYESAMQDLIRLKEKKLWEQGLEKEYFTELTEILRVYLFRRFGINAMEMTSRQILEQVRNSNFKDKRDYIRQILSVADFVKFAKVRPLPADSIAAYDNAVKFVEETGSDASNPEEGNSSEPDSSDTEQNQMSSESTVKEGRAEK